MYRHSLYKKKNDPFHRKRPPFPHLNYSQLLWNIYSYLWLWPRLHANDPEVGLCYQIIGRHLVKHMEANICLSNFTVPSTSPDPGRPIELTWAIAAHGIIWGIYETQNTLQQLTLYLQHERDILLYQLWVWISIGISDFCFGKKSIPW